MEEKTDIINVRVSYMFIYTIILFQVIDYSVQLKTIKGCLFVCWNDFQIILFGVAVWFVYVFSSPLPFDTYKGQKTRG